METPLKAMERIANADVKNNFNIVAAQNWIRCEMWSASNAQEFNLGVVAGRRLLALRLF
jgi:hypothetical protein